MQFEGVSLDGLFENMFGVSPRVVVTYEFLTCASCGTPFAMEKHLNNQVRKNGNTFYCPNGHQNWYGESEADKLRKQLAQEAKKRERLETEAKRYERWYREEQAIKEKAQKRLAATQGVVTRMKNRLANGVCPCCNRHFTNLERHMKSQHPEFADTAAHESTETT